MDPKQEKIVAAIRELNPEDKAHFTRSGLPSSSVLSEKVGESVSAAERDVCWKLFEENFPDEFQKMQAVLSPPDEDQKKTEKKAEKPEDKPLTGEDALKHMRAKGIKV